MSAVLPISASADETSTGSSGSQQSVTELTTEVPATHTVRLSVDSHAQVVADGTAYTGETDLVIGRLVEQTYRIDAADGYAIDQVTYDGSAVSLGADGTFTAPALNRDGIVLKVTAKATPSPTSGKLSDTGVDVARYAIIAAVLLVGAAVTMATVVRMRRSH